jgi:hypothetical protein
MNLRVTLDTRRRAGNLPLVFMQRTLQPELLDSLPPQHPDARHSRRDLRLINRIMGNHRWFARTLPPLLRSGETALEIGSGTGELGVRLAANGVPIDGLDLCPRPDGWPAKGDWQSGDLRSFAGYHRYPAIIGNLIFHQFSREDLAALGKKLRASARLIVACEPWRSRGHQALFAAFAPVFGANRVTRHDGRVSIAAGFQADELPQILGLDEQNWNYHCQKTALGAYRMVAIRRT